MTSLATNPSTLTREAGTSRSATRPARRRPSTSHVLIALAVVLAFGLNYLALQSRDATSSVAVARVPLVEGAVFHSDDIELVEVPADLEGLDGLLSEAELAERQDWIVSRSVAQGHLVGEVSLIEPGSSQGLRVMSIPISPEHAAGATVAVGDRVDVISVLDGKATWVASGLEVVGNADLNQGALGGVGDYFIVVAVDATQALGLAEAIAGGSLEVVRSTGAEPIEEGS